MTVRPPPGPFRRGFWRSPLRGPWFTAVLSVALLPGITLMFLTGLASYAAYNPNLASGNDTTPGKGLLGSWLPGWPAGPFWLYWVNQGVHVTLGLVLIPIVLAKLWSVLPKLFEWLPARSITQLIERASALPQHTARLPIACVEGWSTGEQTWTGVRLTDLAAMAGAAPGTSLFVESLQRGPGFGSATLSAGQVQAPDALLALRVNGADLTADHGFPARIVMPALPGVHNTKWVTRMTFLPATA